MRAFCRRSNFLRLGVVVVVCLCIYKALHSDVENVIYQLIGRQKISIVQGTGKIRQLRRGEDLVASSENISSLSLIGRQKISIVQGTGKIRQLRRGKDLVASSENIPSLSNYCAEPLKETPIDATDDGACRIPKLDPFHPIAMKYINDIKDPLHCKTKSRAILKGGVLRITGSDVETASYRYISRKRHNDFKYELSKPIAVKSFKAFPVKEEFIILTLRLTNAKILKEYLMQAVRRPEIQSRPKIETKLNLGVAIIAIDSISNGHAQRKLPKSFDYIKNVLGGFVFMGHSTVGDGTTEQVAAFLTGKGEQEYHESRRGYLGAKPVDDWNWIFKRAREHGYVTSYCEDSAYIGTFQYRLLGFTEPPTDYYARPFFLAADDHASSLNRNCFGSSKIYKYHLDFAKRLYEEYPDRKKFLLHFAGEISHNSLDSVQLMDDDLLQFMKEFKEKGYLKDTVLIVLGDHGWRAGDFRQTIQGKLEERLPLFTMTFPDWFKDRYPNLAQNLATNTKRLTSWFDVYATFNHLFDYPNNPKNIKHGMSLLDEVPLDRSCQDASIPEHWCPCINWSEVDSNHSHIGWAARAAVNHINNLNFREQLGAELCEELSFYQLSRAEVETPSTKVRRFKRSGSHGYKPEYTAGRIRDKDDCRYQITFVTLPNHAVFEASVHFFNGKFQVKGSVSRLNRYNDQPKCIADVLPHLRKYCMCK